MFCQRYCVAYSDNSQTRKCFAKEGEDGGSGNGVESLELTGCGQIVSHDQSVDESKGDKDDQDDRCAKSDDHHCSDDLHSLYISRRLLDRRTVRKKAAIDMTRTSSMTKMSLENRLRIRPVGVNSKKESGLRIKAENA